MMIKVVLALLGVIVASSQAQAAGETLPSFGLSPGPSPNQVCIFDLSTARPCVTIGTLDSVLHTFTGVAAASGPSVPPFNATGYAGTGFLSTGFSVNQTGIVTTFGLGITKTFNYGGGDNSLANSFIYAPSEAASGACVNLTGSGCIFHNLTVSGDNVDASSNSVATRNMLLEDDIQTAKGSRIGLSAKIIVRQTPGDNTVTNRNYQAGEFYVGSNFTAPVSGTTNLFSMGNYNVVTAAGWNSQVGIEQDMTCGSPCNTPKITGMQIVLLGTNNVTPSLFFNGYLIGSVANAISTVSVAYAIGGYDGWMPIAANGWIMRCVPHTFTGPCADYAGNSTIAHGIDLSDLTFSSDAFKSIGFTVDGTGRVTAGSGSGSFKSSSNVAMVHGSTISDGTNLFLSGNWTGTCDGTVSNGVNFNCAANLISMTNLVAAGSKALSAFSVMDFAGSATTTSAGYIGINAIVDQTGTTGASGTGVQNFIGANLLAQGTRNEGGADINTPLGGAYGLVAGTALGPQATFWKEFIGEEIDVQGQAGSSDWDTVGLQIILSAGHAARGFKTNNAIALTAQTATIGATAGWSCGLCFGGYPGYQPMYTDATLIGAYPNQGTLGGGTPGAYGTVINGVDFTPYTFTGSAFKSIGFSVDGAGNEVTNTTKTAGFTVSGLPAAGTAGRRAYVTDQLTSCPAVGGALTGGGAIKCPVFDNGTAWVSG